MDLKSAIAKVEGMKNLFRAFESVEEVLRLASQADQYAKERKAESDALSKEVESKRAHLDNLNKLIEDARESGENERRSRELAMLEAEKAASEMRAQRLQEFERNFANAMTKAQAMTDSLDAEIRVKAEEKTRLESALSTLRDQLQSLKSSIAGV